MNAGDLVGGKYRLTQRLGAGAMGTVWAAVNERTGRKVALKLILHPTDDLRYRLLREARACGGLEHRNIVEIYDVGETKSGDPFLVMQLLSGETLADLLSRRRTLLPQTAAGIGRDIASALAAAHAAKIVHRDLKPANIFLYREGGQGTEDDFVLKVLDFGVSKNLAIGDGHTTATGMMIGSPAYMSPEQIRMAKDVDHRTDIWSLGIILFELLTGTRPFQGASEEIIRQILTAPIPTVSSRLRHVPPELDAIVTRCLSRDRDGRYHDTKELARTLATFTEASQAPPRIVNAPPAVGLDAAFTVSTPGADAAATVLLQERETPEAAAGRGRFAAAPREGARGPSASPTGTQLMSPTDPISSPVPTWRRELQQALAASRQASPTPAGAFADSPGPSLVTTLLHDTARPEAPKAAEAGAAMKNAAPASPAAGARPPEIRSGDAAPKTPARGKAPWRYVPVAVAVTVIVLLVTSTATRRARPPTVRPPAPGEVAEAPVSPAEPAATPAPSTEVQAPESTVVPIVDTVAPKPRAPSPTPVHPAAASGNPLQPCGRFIKKNCRQARP